MSYLLGGDFNRETLQRGTRSNRSGRARLNRGGPEQCSPRKPLVNNLKHPKEIEHAERQLDKRIKSCSSPHHDSLATSESPYSYVRCSHMCKPKYDKTTANNNSLFSCAVGLVVCCNYASPCEKIQVLCKFVAPRSARR